MLFRSPKPQTPHPKPQTPNPKPHIYLSFTMRVRSVKIPPEVRSLVDDKKQAIEDSYMRLSRSLVDNCINNRSASMHDFAACMIDAEHKADTAKRGLFASSQFCTHKLTECLGQGDKNCADVLRPYYDHVIDKLKS